MRYALIFTAGLIAAAVSAEEQPAASAVPKDEVKSRAAFMDVYKVLMHPRCMNCHPVGDAPLQGEDSHPHIQNVQRGPEGRGVYGMKCTACHQMTNLPGEHMPPGNPKWKLPDAHNKLVFEGKSPAELARQIKDPAQNGGKSLEEIEHHMTEDILVLWGWNPGEGRALPPLSQAEFAEKVREWIHNGAAIPE